MSNPVLTKNYTAESQAMPYRLVSHGASDGGVVHSSAGDASVGCVVQDLGAAAGGRVDVVLMGIGEVKLGGTVAAGGPLAAGADGVAVAATAAGTAVVGWSEESGVEGDIVRYFIGRSKV